MDFTQALLEPEAYPHPVKEIQLVQTHIPWVFLTGEFVYKIKKPVNFGFLDFTTLKKRYHFCQEELRLNRRLSPEIYLEVVPIVQRDRCIYVGGEGKVIDYAVKMKQLPQESCLLSLLERGDLTAFIMKRLAQLMARFYKEAKINEEIATYGLPEKIEVNIKENFDQTASYVGKTINKDVYEALRDYSFRFLTEKKEVFLERIWAKQIKDGHGDFHCANVYWYDNKVYVLDCIEFNTRFRYADVAADVAFLLMDLDFRQASYLGNCFLNAYLTYTNDFGLLKVLDFYKIYRAYVRGKIASFEMDMPEIPKPQRKQAQEKAKRYFDLAYQYLTFPKRPFILAMTGVAFVVGSLSNVYFWEKFKLTSLIYAKGNVDLVIPEYINSAMPQGFVYLFMLVLLSAAMSTNSSQFHALGTAIVRDILQTLGLLKRDDPKKEMFAMKIGIAIMVIFTIIVAYTLPPGFIARGTAIFFGLCAASFLPAYFGAEP